MIKEMKKRLDRIEAEFNDLNKKVNNAKSFVDQSSQRLMELSGAYRELNNIIVEFEKPKEEKKDE